MFLRHTFFKDGQVSAMSLSKSTTWVKALLMGVGGVLFGASLGLALVTLMATTFWNWHILSVASSSMKPAFDKGDIVVVRPITADKVKRGDVIYFTTTGGLPEVHRVVAVDTIVVIAHNTAGKEVGRDTQYRFVTKGDANKTLDAGFTTQNRVHGEVWFHIPTYGLIGSGNSVTLILFAIAGAIAVLWVVWEIAHLRRRRVGSPGQGSTVPGSDAPGTVGEEARHQNAPAEDIGASP